MAKQRLWQNKAWTTLCSMHKMKLIDIRTLVDGRVLGLYNSESNCRYLHILTQKEIYKMNHGTEKEKEK